MSIHTDRMDDKMNQRDIHYGIRGEKFIEFLHGLLKRGNLKEKYLAELTDPENIKIFNTAFTSKTVDPVDNYEILEQLGDQSLGKFIVSYSYERFPQLRCTAGVNIVSRLRINLVSNIYCSRFADKLGFFPFISVEEQSIITQDDKINVLGDCFESFLGATETILNNIYSLGVGYAIVYSILENIYNEEDISLDYNFLFDAKTRLKELFDAFPVQKGNLPGLGRKVIYKNINLDNGNILVEVHCQYYGKIGEALGRIKSETEQEAAQIALDNLEKMGYKKQATEFSKIFC